MTQKIGEVHSGSHAGLSANGAVDWKFEAGNKDVKHQKLKAYTVEYIYMKDGEFILLDSECKRVKSFDEISENNADSLPLKIRGRYTYYVD